MLERLRAWVKKIRRSSWLHLKQMSAKLGSVYSATVNTVGRIPLFLWEMITSNTTRRLFELAAFAGVALVFWQYYSEAPERRKDRLIRELETSISCLQPLPRLRDLARHSIEVTRQFEQFKNQAGGPDHITANFPVIGPLVPEIGPDARVVPDYLQQPIVKVAVKCHSLGHSSPEMRAYLRELGALPPKPNCEGCGGYPLPDYIPWLTVRPVDMTEQERMANDKIVGSDDPAKTISTLNKSWYFEQRDLYLESKRENRETVPSKGSSKNPGSK